MQIRNPRLHRSLLRALRAVIDDLELADLQLEGRMYTWSNERDRPALERLDRALASADWLEEHPTYSLRCLSIDCSDSDHAPLLMVLNFEPWARPRFRFHNFWIKLDGFLEVVTLAWEGAHINADTCRLLDHKIR